MPAFQFIQRKAAIARNLTIAATQMQCTWDLDDNIDRAERLVRDAHAQGARIVLLPELFLTPYFCIDGDACNLAIATPHDDSVLIRHFQALARELGVVLPLSFLEKANDVYFNSLVVIDAGGTALRHYRQAHIPTGIGHQERQFFTPGDTGFRVWDTRYARIGVGIGWDQWFPETQRSLALMGAELIFQPAAFAFEPGPAGGDESRAQWIRVQQGAAAANLIPVIASNRIGTETSWSHQDLHLTFYGSAFIADQTGALAAQADPVTEGFIVHCFDLEAIARQRDGWGGLRERRPELYEALLRRDGRAGPGEAGPIP